MILSFLVRALFVGSTVLMALRISRVRAFITSRIPGTVGVLDVIAPEDDVLFRRRTGRRIVRNVREAVDNAIDTSM